MRNSSLRRRASAAATASSAVSCLRTVAAASACRAAAAARASLASSPSIATASGARSSSSVAYRLDASSLAIRRATLVSSRSSLRYHDESPSASLTWWNARSPASGCAASANQPSIDGQQRPLDGGPA